jgi:protein tyrosine phosphatase
VILGDRIGGADESYDAFINANLIHKGIIAMQCPLEGTVLDTQRMFVEQNVSLWIQLAPYEDTATGTVPMVQQCKITPTDFVQHTAAHNSTLLRVTDYVQLPNMQLGIQNPSFNVHAFDVHLTSLTAGVTRTQRVTNVWYKQWQDFEIPAAGDTQVTYFARLTFSSTSE